MFNSNQRHCSFCRFALFQQRLHPYPAHPFAVSAFFRRRNAASYHLDLLAHSWWACRRFPIRAIPRATSRWAMAIQNRHQMWLGRRSLLLVAGACYVFLSWLDALHVCLIHPISHSIQPLVLLLCVVSFGFHICSHFHFRLPSVSAFASHVNYRLVATVGPLCHPQVPVPVVGLGLGRR